MDRVQVLKREQAELGGDPFDEQPWPEPIQPQEDAVEVAGIYLQDSSNRDETTLIDRSADDMRFKDGNNPSPVTLTELLESGSALPINVSFSSVLTFLVAHNRGVKPLVQVVEPSGAGWNVGGWNNDGWNEGFGGHVRIPDNTYVLKHIDDNAFIVTFSAKTTGQVIYF